YLLNGTKYYSTGTLYSDYVLVRTADSAGVNAAALIPVNREGIELIDDWDGLGQRLTATGSTHFRQVRVKRQEVVFDAPDAGYGNAVEAAHWAALLSAKAKIVADEFTIRGGSLLFDVGGASATKKVTNFDRHWRNARTLSSHNPTTYKARSIGQYEISGTPLP